MKLTLYITLFLVILNVSVQAQNERKFVREGNRYYEKALADTTKIDTTMYSQAETAYRKALDKKPDDLKWNFNLGDALYKQMKFEESAAKFGEIADKSTDKVEQGRSLHNMGNSLLMQNKLEESIKAYKDALRKNPDDLETKYNLLYAMNLKKKQDQQQQNKDQNKDKNKDQNKDQNKDDQNKDKQDQNKDQQNKDQQNKDQNQNKDQQDQQKQQQQQQQNKISKENAERLLQALQNDEKKLQEKVKKMQAVKAKAKQTEKDW